MANRTNPNKANQIPDYDGEMPGCALSFLKSYDDNNIDDVSTGITPIDATPSEAPHIETVRRRAGGRKSKVDKVSATDKAKTSLYISPETLHDLRVYCADVGLKMTDFVEMAIVDRLKAEKKKKAKEA